MACALDGGIHLLHYQTHYHTPSIVSWYTKWGAISKAEVCVLHSRGPGDRILSGFLGQQKFAKAQGTLSRRCVAILILIRQVCKLGLASICRNWPLFQVSTREISERCTVPLQTGPNPHLHETTICACQPIRRAGPSNILHVKGTFAT